MSDDRILRRGDRITTKPCDVTITSVGVNPATHAMGYCSTCECAHIIEAAQFAAGRGPWRRIEESDV